MRLLKAKEVAERTSISIPQMRRMANDGKFPQPMKISENRTAWLETDIDDWVDACVKQHRNSLHQ